MLREDNSFGCNGIHVREDMQIVLVVLALLTVSSAFQQEEGPPEPVGRETCLGCHDVEAPFSQSTHGESECESCHGPGSIHAESAGDVSIGPAEKTVSWVSQQCMSCHALGESHVADYDRSPHGKNQVSCLDCHRIHPERSEFGLLKGEVVPLCVSCHKASEAEFRKPYHHPVLEGGMSCLDCHSPHSDPQRSTRRLEVFPRFGCVTCHVDKRGPFAFEHTPVTVNGCQECHQSHGSVNPLMLTRSDVHQLCLECHSFTPGVATSQPPSFHDIRSSRYRNCTVCHRAIHGSYVSPLFLR